MTLFIDMIMETFQTFYGISHMIEFITPMNPLNSSISNSLFYTSQARKLNTTYNRWNDVELKTFDRAWAYNDTQSSGYLDVWYLITIHSNSGL